MSRERNDKPVNGAVFPPPTRHEEIDPDTHMTGGVLEGDDWVIEDDE